jgi:Zn-finger nucleic acid-binding protein
MDMKCPACVNELTEKRIGGLAVDVCHAGCGGIWFDAFELQRVDEERETSGAVLLEIERDERIHIDPSRKRECPRCPDIKLKRRLFAPGSTVAVDECPNCGGFWLDAGELAKIRAEKTQAQIAAAGKAHLANVSAEVIRYLYRMKTETAESE